MTTELVCLAFPNREDAERALAALDFLKREQVIDSLDTAGAALFAGSLGSVGIEERFLRDLRKSVAPGGSALFLLLRSGEVGRVVGALPAFEAALLRTPLGPDREAALAELLEERRKEAGRERRQDDGRVDEAGDESFPASDPPGNF